METSLFGGGMSDESEEGTGECTVKKKTTKEEYRIECVSFDVLY